jgi:hypothetical protein
LSSTVNTLPPVKTVVPSPVASVFDPEQPGSKKARLAAAALFLMKPRLLIAEKSIPQLQDHPLPLSALAFIVLNALFPVTNP